ncbi:conjugal transfer protein TraU [Sulfuricurvum sp. IAE1]|uniref:TraU family protein n=1 Tax=Sulfuricurvum sp. IAE1 TaxID=2546102 RepID=UPI00104D076F|nr:TraU family protein [Sulfuricurvum sp. IAE1]TDA63633.1 conjugal transfer protein TraU [Sulfuricurvum sp. IAE1]
MKFTKLVIKAVLTAAVIGSAASANPASSAACKVATRGTSSAMQIALSTVATVHNVFPIRIAGVDINPTANEDSSLNGSRNPICTCMDPFPRVGITLSLWEPILISEPTAIPYCTPTLGTSLPVSVGLGAASFGQNNSDNTKQTYTYQIQLIKYPIFKLLGLFLDFVCLQDSGNLDYLYITELDPLWQNDIWAAIIGPEAFLVANPIAEMACMVDAVTSAVGFPTDPLWWCLGSWNGTFPMTQTNKGTSAMQAQAAMTSRMLSKMHRQLMLKGGVGNQGLCGLYPMPIMQKSQYGIFPVYPFVWPNRIPIGRTGVMWEAGFDNPANQHVGAWMVYRKRDCCAF